MKQLIGKILIMGSLLLGFGVIACENTNNRNRDNEAPASTSDYNNGTSANDNTVNDVASGTTSETDTTYRNHMQDSTMQNNNSNSNRANTNTSNSNRQMPDSTGRR
jgi:hypothetical protein